MGSKALPAPAVCPKAANAARCTAVDVPRNAARTTDDGDAMANTVDSSGFGYLSRLHCARPDPSTQWGSYYDRKGSCYDRHLGRWLRSQVHVQVRWRGLLVIAALIIEPTNGGSTKMNCRATRALPREHDCVPFPGESRTHATRHRLRRDHHCDFPSGDFLRWRRKRRSLVCAGLRSPPR